MRLFWFHFILALFFMQYGCDCNSKQNNAVANQPVTSSPEPKSGNVERRIIFIVDRSASIGDPAVEKIADKVSKFVKDMPNNSECILFVTNENSYDVPSFSWLKKLPSPPDARKVYLSDTIDYKVQQTRSTVLGFYKSPTSNSCIIQTIKSVYNFLNGSIPARKTHLLILSDMMEDCGKVRPGNPAAFKNEIKRIPEYNLNMTPVKNFIPLENICIDLSALNSSPTIKQCQDSPEFNLFWDETFKAFGYEKAPEFTTSIDAFKAKFLK